jgi:acyl carrier protein
MTDSAEAKLTAIVRLALNLPPDMDVRRARQLSVDSWDSLAHVSMMLALEDEFNVKIPLADQMRLVSYEAIKQYLEERAV